MTKSGKLHTYKLKITTGSKQVQIEMILNQLFLSFICFVCFVSGSDKVVVEQEHEKIPNSMNKYEGTVDELMSFCNVMSFVELICLESLKQKNPKAFSAAWIEGLTRFVQEIYVQNSIKEDQFDEETFFTGENYDAETLNPGKEDFDEATLKSNYQILLSDDDLETEKSFMNTFDPLSGILNSLIKAKMVKDLEEDQYSEDFEQTSEQGEEIKEYKMQFDEISNSSEDEKSDDDDHDLHDNFKHVALGLKKKHKGRKFPKGVYADLLDYNDLNLQASCEVEDSSIGMNPNEGEMMASTANIPGIQGISVGGSNGDISLDQAVLIEQIQQQVMDKFMEQLSNRHPELANFTSLLQSEREKLTAVIPQDENGIPQMSAEAIFQYLRTSALPKLINSGIKGKTGIDLLKSLSMALRVINEGLGIFETILRVLITTTRKIRHYTVFFASVVADMAREDNMAPLVDLSVSVEAVPEVAAKKSMTHGMNKMFRRSIKKTSLDLSQIEEEDEDIYHLKDPFTLGMQAALSKARDYTSELNELPRGLLLTIIHTIFTQLEKRDGIVRKSLTKKEHQTLIGLQTTVNKAIEAVYKAVSISNSDAAGNLSKAPHTIFTDILLSLISTVKMDPATINNHIDKVIKWIKPLMSIFDEDSQLNILNFLLNDSEAEQIFAKSNGLTLNKPVKRFNWSSRRKNKF